MKDVVVLVAIVYLGLIVTHTEHTVRVTTLVIEVVVDAVTGANASIYITVADEKESAHNVHRPLNYFQLWSLFQNLPIFLAVVSAVCSRQMITLLSEPMSFGLNPLSKL